MQREATAKMKVAYGKLLETTSRVVAAVAMGRPAFNLVAAKILLYCDSKVGPEQWAQAHFFIGFDFRSGKTE